MFGYITPNLSVMDDDQRKRYRQAYCGLCHAIRDRYGLHETIALSNDLTFLALLTDALEDEDCELKEARCLPHPLHLHRFREGRPYERAAGINVLLAYYKQLDDRADERNLFAGIRAGAMKSAFLKAAEAFPREHAAIEKWLGEIRVLEQGNLREPDLPANCTGQMFGALFALGSEWWSEQLQHLGEGLGRFIYLMDAYEDAPEDRKRGRYNPLIDLAEQPGYEALIKTSLMDMAAQSAEAFEALPITEDGDLLRNILYSGIWSRYERLQQRKREKHDGSL